MGGFENSVAIRQGHPRLRREGFYLDYVKSLCRLRRQNIFS